MKARALKLDGSMIDITVVSEQTGDLITAKPKVDDWSDIRYIDFGYDLAEADAGDKGYFVIPRGSNSPSDHICAFTEREDAELDCFNFQLMMYGFTDGKRGFCAIPTGYTYEYHVIVGVKGGHYYMFARFPIGGKEPYEEISIEYRLLSGENADYSGMGRAYREYLLTEAGVKSLKDRMNPSIDYAKDAMYIRIRQAWKPVPSPVEEQTDENEPPIYVAIDFEKVGKLMEQLKAAGLEKAEFCLVGWNKSGHDGRWPQALPVEPLLGGEEGLEKLRVKAKELGYALTCHMNVTDAYSIANNYSDDLPAIDENGRICKHGGTWGGGRGRWICAKKAVEIAKEELPKVGALGFRGLNYIDVISTIALRPCYSENHPVNRREAANCWKEIAKLNHDVFGGFSSEGGYDYTLPYLDYGLYVSFYDTNTKDLPKLFDKPVPLWQVALHGIVMSNPFTSTVNAPVKERRHQLEVLEYGGRPTIYIYSKFLSSGSNWMGNDDIVCDTDEQMADCVEKLSAMYREHKDLFRLQTEFIEKHEELSDGVFRTTYSDGTTVTVDYNRETYSVEKN